MKFLCDAMLGHIGRKLRMAGYDTLIEKGERSDVQLVELAERENRFLLTCDQKIQEIKGSTGKHICLSQNDEILWARYLTHKLGVDWLFAPFTRCIECNHLLQKISEEAYHRLPLNIQQQGQQGLFCSHCNKVYWEGSHVERMKKQLQQLSIAAKS